MMDGRNTHQVNEPLIEVRNVTKKYPLYENQTDRIKQALVPSFRRKKEADAATKIALNDISFDVSRGEKLGLIGSNGSGKTTLLKLIAQKSNPTSGSISVSGQVEALMSASGHTVDNFTGRESIRAALAVSGLPRSEEKTALEDIVDFVELGTFLDYPVRTYSLGMRARLEFAIATAIRPSVLIVDEVLGAGDGYFAKKSADRIRKLFAETSLILVSHSMQQIREFCDRAIWLNEGYLVRDGEPDEVVEEYEKYMANAYRGSDNSLVGLQECAHEASGAGVSGDLDSSEEIILGRRVAGAKSRALFAETEADLGNVPKLLAARYCDGAEKVCVTETGKSICVAVDIEIASGCSQKFYVSMFGFSANGVLMWKSSASEVPAEEGKWQISLLSEKVPAGVGDYFISILLHSGRDAMDVVLGSFHAELHLKLMETNYSDPPYFHVPASWDIKRQKGRIRQRISAWV